ncbi:MAG: Bifunctional protein HldE [Chlamydiia bacterium]|nr:Bifunctional protein HldE [Chlamydiia bacterium]MCH9615133.1 Bifunctional protein HldE [Chlamydiia bacterium]MCH9628545.1 Bifunctional protein HldE [Chlamydiia bacterium]
MLDHYTVGHVSRISPEAPVPVLKVCDEHNLPGGAGNVCQNLEALGSEVALIGRVGNDSAGKAFKRFFANTTGILTQPSYKTPVKNRLIANSQQLLRTDLEEIIPTTRKLEKSALMLAAEAEVVAISDYGKGFLTDSLLTELMCLGLPTLVDPKGEDFSKYRGATLIKPNLKEAMGAVKTPGTLDQVAEQLLETTRVKYLLITRSQDGISLFTDCGKRHDFPVHSKEVVDVTGAGDTVLSVISVAMANKLPIEEAVRMANIAASIAIEKVGCARVTLAEIGERMLTKVVDASHVFLFRKVLEKNAHKFLEVASTDHLPLDVLEEIQGSLEEKLVVVVEDDASERLISLLASFEQVDFVLRLELAESFNAFL